ncbi:hypothetical protein L7F22_045960 [Adiantum nelumboides]|nr:hypothetical protein [Adiantum nelumboides]
MRATPQAMTLTVQARDAAMQDLQRRLQAALGEVEQGKAREAALQRRAEVAEATEEALVSELAELEAEAYASITQSNKIQKDEGQSAEDAWMVSQEETMGARQRIAELERRLQAAMEEAGGWERRYREATTQCTAAAVPEQQIKQRRVKTGKPAAERQMADLQQRLAEAEQASAAAQSQLKRAVEQAAEEKFKEVESEAILSLRLQELVAVVVKLRLMSPTSNALKPTSI